MGFLKKLTRPISRVLDKIVPNEIKPALPFLAAAVPFLAPTAGIFGTMAGRAALSGGANLLAQLSQEGSEGDFNPLTALLATGTGALSAPRIGFGTNPGVSPAEYFGTRAGLASEGTGIMSKASELGFTGLEKGARFLSAAKDSGGAGDILRPGGTKAGLDLATAQAVTLPATTGTMDLAFAETNRFNKQQIIDDALGGLGEGASDADRALAIRLAMQQYGFTDDEISETIESAGYKDGGIIGLQVEMIEGKKDGGRIGFRDGSSTGDFGRNRFLAEMIETYGGDLDRAGKFTDKIEGILATEKFPDPETLKSMRKEYEDIVDKFGKTEDIFASFEDKISEKDKDTFYGKKIMDLEKRFEDEEKRFDDADTKFGETKFDASDITRTPDFQAWLRLYESGDPLAKRHPYHDEFEEILFSDLKGRDQSYKQMVGKKDGGLMNLGGKEMDLRGGGFVPIGKKEKADDVPARLSKNEFVMTADAVRAAGGGSVNKGAKRMYDLMDRLEARA